MDVVGSGWPKGKRVSVRVTRRWAILVDFRSLDETVRCKVDPPRAGPGSSNVREQREGEGKVLLAGSTGQFRSRKTAKGQVHKMPHLMFISSFRTIVRN